MSYPFDPLRPIINLSDTRLQRIFVKENYNYATLFEYSQATGISSEALFTVLQPYVQSGDLDIDPIGGELFLRSMPAKSALSPQIPPNLWDLLRIKLDEEEAFNLWRLIRDMQSGGWIVEADPNKMPVNSENLKSLIALKIRTTYFPVLILPPANDIANQAGPLTKFLLTNNRMIAIVTRSNEVELISTMIRKWLLGRPHRSDITILILPEPRYQPIIINSKDQSLTPVTVTREDLDKI